nr:energy-coupling factor ABC transporter ATP-binding protein [Dichotomicrobium thermohalophilum]
MPVIELRDVRHDFDGVPVLCGLNLRLAERRIAIIGDNGSGKSTLARMLNGLLVPRAGEVKIDGASTRDDPAAARAAIGLVFQNPEHQIIMPTVEEDLAFGPRNLNLPRAEIAARVDDLLVRYGLADKRTQPAHLLSGGEKKLLSILSVVIMRPRTIVFDEPMTSLDRRNRARIARVMAELPQQLITITHDLDLIVDYDRAILLAGGELVADGPPQEVIARYEQQDET